ncbi:MAG: hypothetical protein AABY04_02505, partial [Candidatus Micrarchaeota archaeon]
MLKSMLFLLFVASAAAIEITQFELVFENSQNYLAVGLTPGNSFDNMILTPDDAIQESGGKFSIAGNISIQINVTNASSLFEIRNELLEDVFTPTESIWCGGVFNTCSNCGGMPVGTFKWCNGAYPLTTYSCDNWCYTYGTAPSYVKTETGAFVKNSAQISIKTIANGQSEMSLDENHLQETTEMATGFAAIPQIVPSMLPKNLIREKTSNAWREILPIDYQNYKNELAYYYGAYASSISSAKTATGKLSSALGNMISNAKGNYVEQYKQDLGELPKITLKLRADFAGVIALRGKPKIITLGTIAKFENGLAFYEAEFENAGYATDTFSGNLSCENETAIWQSGREVLENGKIGKMKFFVEKMETPKLCLARIFVLDYASLFDEKIAILEPFRMACPADYQCCSNSQNYNDRACQSEERFRPDDSLGNGAYYTQNFVCENYICKGGSIAITRRISGILPSTQNTVLFASANYDSPKPTTAPATKEIEIKKDEIDKISEPQKTPAPKQIEIAEEIIDIILPDHAFLGYQEVFVKINDMPASGDVELESPTGKNYAFRLDLGSAQVLLNEEGRWKIQYKEEKKQIYAQKLDTKSISDNIGNEKNAALATSFLSLGMSKVPFVETVLILALAAFGFAGVRRHSEKVHFKKSFENNIVRLEIFNNLADLRNLEITDIVPEGQVLSTISNPPSEVTEIIFGKHIKWKKE